MVKGRNQNASCASVASGGSVLEGGKISIDRNLYLYTEQALRDYPDECRRLKLLEEYYAAGSNPCEAGFVQGGRTIAEQERIMEHKLRNTELRGLTLKVASVESFLESLGVGDRAFVRLRYFEQLSWRQVAEELYVSEQACKYRWAPRVVKRAARLIFGDLVKV